MTIIADLTITPIGIGGSRVSWTGTAQKTVRVFLNGILAFGPDVMGTDAKEVQISLPDPGTIEVHENDGDETVPAASIPLARRPLVWWRSVEGAAHYRVYLGGTLVGVVAHESSRLHHELLVSQDVRVDGGAWTDLRVEAVSAAGVETVTDPQPFFAPGVPLEPSDVTVSGTGGIFSVEVTP